MTVIIMKQTAIGKRAYAISREDAETLVAEGKAIQDAVYGGIYEEVTPEEVDQGYMTRNMLPLPDAQVKRKPARSSKSRSDDNRSDED